MVSIFKQLSRRLSLLFILSLLLLVTGCHHQIALMKLDYPEFSLSKNDRVLVLAPHPDDEVIACAGVIQHALAQQIPLRVVFLTYGDSNQWSFIRYRKHPVLLPRAIKGMGLVRHDEALAAGAMLGIPASAETFLGYPDFGTLSIWTSHWGETPYKSLLTRATAVPYKNAFRPDAQYRAEDILADLKQIINEAQPTKIFLSHPADTNPDHQALYLFTQIALWELHLEPKLYPYLVHHHGWPLPHGLQPEIQLAPPFVYAQPVHWVILPLDSREVERKMDAIKKHRSQMSYSAGYLYSFVRTNELFGDFSEIEISGYKPYVDIAPVQLNPAGDVEINKRVQPQITVEKEIIWLTADSINISLQFSKVLEEPLLLYIYLFGYRDDVSFSKMSKIRIELTPTRHTILDEAGIASTTGATVTRQWKEFVISVPIKTLGDPKKIITGMSSHIGTLPYDWSAWRIIELSGKGIVPQEASPAAPANSEGQPSP